MYNIERITKQEQLSIDEHNSLNSQNGLNCVKQTDTQD